MASIKFSAFTNEAVDAATTQLVGYKVGDATANYRYSITQLATALSPSIDNFYTADGTIGTTRIAKVTDTVTFQNAGGTSSLFSLNTDGTFALGHGATNAAGSTSVPIGISASTVAQYSVAIGRQAVVSNGMHTYSTVVGNQAGVLGGQSVSLGSYSAAAASSVAIGHSAGGAGTPAINIGHSSQGTGNNAITLNVSGGAAAPSTQYQYGVYMTSNAYPDFSVTSNVSKFSFDADSFATLTIADASDTTLASGETGDITIDAGGGVKIDADSGAITFADGGVTLATIASLRQECFMMAASDETTDITVAADKVRIQMPYAFTLTEIKASLTTAPTGSGATTVNVYNVTDGDTVINTAALSFAAAAISANSTSFTAGQETIAEDAVIAVDVAAIAGTTGGAGLKVTLIGYQTV